MAVAEQLSFRRAASLLFLTQPALSRRIALLEKELGVTLFERKGRTIELTPSGEALQTRAIRLLRDAEEAAHAARLAGFGKNRFLRVLYTGTGMSERPIHCVDAFRRQEPDVAVVVSLGSTTRNIAAVLDGSVDVAFVRLPIGEHSALEVLPFDREPIVLALSEDHPLAAKDQLEVADVRDEPVVLFPRRDSPGLYETIVEQVWGDADAVVRVVAEKRGEESMLMSTAAGMGVTFIMKSRAEHVRHPQVVYRPFAPPGVYSTMGAIWLSEGATSVVHEFVDFLRERVLPQPD